MNLTWVSTVDGKLLIKYCEAFKMLLSWKPWMMEED